MKIGLFGCKSTTKWMVDELRNIIPIRFVITVAPGLAKKHNIADYYNISKDMYYYLNNNINGYAVGTYLLKDDRDYEEIKKQNLDIAFCIGWQRLIPERVLKLFPLGVFGMHGSAEGLPRGRGRSPLNWSIIEGRELFKTSLFKYEPGIDDGRIFETEIFKINHSDTAETLHFKNMIAMRDLIIKLMNELKYDKRILTRKQNNDQPTYYPKRNLDDSLIDWSINIVEIERFIRAVSKPFNGAFTFIENDDDLWKITIHSASIFSDDYPYDYAKILEVFPNGKFLISCCGGVLIIHEYETEGKIFKGAKLTNGKMKIKEFPKNINGYYDLTIEEIKNAEK